jgi:hypothetical protein
MIKGPVGPNFFAFIYAIFLNISMEVLRVYSILRFFGGGAALDKQQRDK